MIFVAIAAIGAVIVGCVLGSWQLGRMIVQSAGEITADIRVEQKVLRDRIKRLEEKCGFPVKGE